VTTSHNPANYNGIKFVGKDSRLIGSASGLLEMKALFANNQYGLYSPTGTLNRVDRRQAYIQHLLNFVKLMNLRPLNLMVNPGNGGAGAIVVALEAHLPFHFTKVQFEADGDFPNGVPNPLLVENRRVSHDAVLASGADFGIA
jgi:phosphomannomutase